MKKIFKENPDEVCDGDDIYASCAAEDALTFGYLNGKFIVDSEYHYKTAPRNKFVFPGRLWADDKIISLWGKYPTRSELSKLLDDIKKQVKSEEFKAEYYSTYEFRKSIDSLDINSYDWKIDIPVEDPDNVHGKEFGSGMVMQHYSTVIPIHDYERNSKTVQNKQFDDIQHTVSPIAKKQKEIPNGMGSKKKLGGLTQFQADAMRDLAEDIAYVKKLYKECPDKISTDEVSVTADMLDAYTFGYDAENNFIIEKTNKHYIFSHTHHTMFDTERLNGKFFGRFWKNHQVISFWGKYPTPAELQKILKDIKDKGFTVIHSKLLIDVPIIEGHEFEQNKIADDIDDVVLGYHGAPSILLTLGDYIEKYSGKNTATQDSEVQHVLSPVAKKQKTVPAGVGSKKRLAGLTPSQADAMRDLAEEAVKLVKSLLKESPDMVNAPSQLTSMLRASDSDAYTFGYDDDSGTFKIEPTNENFKLYNTHTNMFGDLFDISLQGRLWEKRKVISFWGHYPTPQQLKIIIDDIEENSEIQIDYNDWMIDIPSSSNYSTEIEYDSVDDIVGDYSHRCVLVSISDYIKKYSKDSTTQSDDRVQHVLSPIAKKQKEIPNGMGSKKRIGGLTPSQADAIRGLAEDEVTECMGATMNIKDNRFHQKKLKKLKKVLATQGDKMITYPKLAHTVYNVPWNRLLKNK